MSTRKIDYERGYTPGRPGVGGVIIRTNPTLNMDVYMYLDDPGVYLNVYGKPVPPALAAEAGFDIGRWEKARKKKQAFLVFKSEQEAIEAADESEDARKVVAESDGFSLIELPLGRGTIIGPDGGFLFPPTAFSTAKKAFDSMVLGIPEEGSKSEYEADVDAELKMPKTAAQIKRAKTT